MTTESTQPQPEAGASPAASPGQSQGHRRRRRRRKNKSTHPGAAQMQQPPMQPAQGPPQPPPAPRPQQAQGPQNQGQHGGAHGRKKKKKFFQKGAGPPQPQGQPGNSIHPPHQSKRKNKQRGPREFVGPMDHSYRAVNGNVADGPASTIPTSGNGHANYYSDNFAAAPAAPIRHDAPARIYCFIEDLFFLAKINETARKLGVKVEFVKSADKEATARILEAPEEERARLIVFDLNNANAKPLTLIPKFKSKLKKSVSVIGFLSHLQGDLKAKATEAGCDTVMPRSAFSQSLPNLLRRYGLEEQEEHDAQPTF